MDTTSSEKVPTQTLVSSTSLDNMSALADSLKTKVKNFLKPVPVSMGVFAALLVFLAVLVFNLKETYKFTNKYLSTLVGKTLDEEKDCPSQRGVIIHSIVAALIAGALVYYFHDTALNQLKKLLA
jgi:hypothetical protein